MKIRKHSGEIVNFDREKLIRSLQNANATREIAEQIVNEVETQFYEGITSKQIFRIAFKKLKTFSKAHAARYNLKNGIMKLGPTGFYFEKFIARIFNLQGFQTQTNIFLEGKCITHEIDVIVKNEKHISIVECKFHGNQETKTDVKIPMYFLSRFNDLKNRNFSLFNSTEFISNAYLVTNNKFTSEAIKFGECSGLYLLSWNYPFGNSIKDLVAKYNVFPITCLTTLTEMEKEILLLEDTLTVYDFVRKEKKKSKLKLSQNRLNNVLNECNQLLN